MTRGPLASLALVARPLSARAAHAANALCAPEHGGPALVPRR